MLAGRGVEAGIGQPQPFDGFSFDDVGLNDFFHVRLGDVSIPDCFRIKHHGRPVFALIQTAGLVRAYFPFHSKRREFLLEELLQVSIGLGIAASPRMSRWPLVSANENVTFKFRHQPAIRCVART
jgi:hypothetical protein